MDVESALRVRLGIKKEQDMVGLIEAAVNVAALIDPEKLKKHRSRIMKLLFDEDPGNAARELFSDNELLKVTSPPAKHTSHSTETIKKLGFKKSVEQELSQVAVAAPPLKMVGRQDKPMEATKKMLGRKNPQEDELVKVTSTPAKNTSHSREIKKTVKEELSPPPVPPLMMEATKKMLGRKYPHEEEEAEKKAAKKRKIDFPEPKKHCDSRSKAKLPGGYVRRLNATIKSIMN